jgi:DNA-binding NarL/FixJ family response regulator
MDTRGPTSIVIAEDHEVVREGLKLILSAHPDFLVAGEAADGEQAIEMVRRTQPDVLLMDLLMPSCSGLDVIQQIMQPRCPTRVLVLSMHSAGAYVQECFRRGALGYVLKNDGAQYLVQAVRAVAAGKRYLSPLLAERLLDTYAGSSPSSDPLRALTDRERQIFFLMLDGRSTNEAATLLTLSPRTAETHRQNMLHKLKVADSVGLLDFASRHGILVPSESAAR